MYTSVLSQEALALLIELGNEPLLREYRLVGGTSLALQRGHRKSIDLDFFVVSNAHPPELDLLLIEKYEAKKLSSLSSGLIKSSFIRSIKVDLVCYPYPWLDPALIWQQVAFASLKDIAAMKVSAIGQRGSKKDFFDLAELLQIFSLQEILNFFSERYPAANRLHYLQSITFFADAEGDMDPYLLSPQNCWEKVKTVLRSAVAEIIMTSAQ